jgi:hypothetical protein
MAKMGRPQKEIDFSVLDKLCHIQCTLKEIAGWFDVCEDTIEKRVKDNFGITFSEYFEQKRGNGKISLRRKMYEMALAGDRVMCIWLSKQYLGMSEKQEIRQESDVKLNMEGFKFVEPNE